MQDYRKLAVWKKSFKLVLDVRVFCVPQEPRRSAGSRPAISGRHLNTVKYCGRSEPGLTP